MRRPREYSLAQLMRLIRDLDAGKLDRQLLDNQQPVVEAPIRRCSGLEAFDIADWVRRMDIKLPRR